jgi:hypothetical protein
MIKFHNVMRKEAFAISTRLRLFIEDQEEFSPLTIGFSIIINLDFMPFIVLMIRLKNLRSIFLIILLHVIRFGHVSLHESVG